MDTNLATLHRWLDSINRHDLSEIDSFVTEDIVDHHLPPGLPPGRAGVALWCSMLCDALQMHIAIEDTIEQDDRIAVRATISGRHVADFLGLPATNRSFSASMMSVERFNGGQVVERWENVDHASIMQQLTAV